jgi:cysteine desulfuration protein SufE
MEMKEIKALEEEIIEEFSWFEDPMEKYEHIIDLGKSLDDYPEQYRDENHLVKGCQSKVWLHAEPKSGKLHFYADSNTFITKGIIALLLRVLNNRQPDEIISSELSFIDAIDLRSHLSSQRSNGLTAMIEKIRAYAKMAKEI